MTKLDFHNYYLNHKPISFMAFFINGRDTIMWNLRLLNEARFKMFTFELIMCLLQYVFSNT